ncbi:membrane protein [Microbacterium phage Caron]|uniref:Membrane protein n=1 Tax=Microbacterium phage Caron TaxID=3028494 RepID=A0AAF0CJJ6_9CAUD|nr:membrane protein [Microbacterium phage Caron]
MTDSTAAPVSVSADQRRAALVKALRKYRDEGYAVELSSDGFTATLTRRTRVKGWLVLVLTLFTLVGGIIYYAVKTANRKTQSVVLYVDERGKVTKA